MPQKPLRERIKRAKREGIPFSIKANDLEPASGKSRHALKKSRGVVAVELPPDRRVGMKAAPGRGRNRAGAEVEPPRGLKGQVDRGVEIQTPHEIPVRGRKKPPSEVHIRHPGG
jgi:hypothetical protein